MALPNGNPSAQPTFLLAPSNYSLVDATEDANRIYWLLEDGTLSSCLLATCNASNKKNLVTNIASPTGLYQDSQYLYYTSFASGQGLLMRVAK